MSRIHGLLDPEARATVEAVWAKLAAPGMCNPEDETPAWTANPVRTRCVVICARRGSAITTR
jgi:hypothetical protein